MAHFAKLDENNVVTDVIVVSNDVATTEDAGISFLRNLYKEPTSNWKQTSYNSTIRKNFAGVDFTYDPVRDAFIPPKPYDSWILNETTCRWEAPVICPNTYINNIVNIHNEQIPDTYLWNEETKTWDFEEE
jgi:hypothetical protein